MTDPSDSALIEFAPETYEELKARCDLYYSALIQIDVYLANDPDLWRINNVCKAGDVLCDVLGAEVIQGINASVIANLCVKCGERKTE